MNAAVYLNALGIVSALGGDKEETRAALFCGQHRGVTLDAGLASGRSLHLGSVRSPLVDLSCLPQSQRSRNNALMLTALAQVRPCVETAISRFGGHRVGVVIGTSTSGIGESERALAFHQMHGDLPDTFDLAQQEMGSPAVALSALLGLRGPAYSISTACSSSAKALASAARLLRAGLCDAVLVGGVDSLCNFTVAGFSALESVSLERCNPMSAHRNGINIGEGAALFLMTREPGPVCLEGWGETSDAHHISSPEPSGRGALAAMRAALLRAQLHACDVDYLNMHGTATIQNDAMESRAIFELFGAGVAVSSTKPLTGHTLGAAGAIEAALCWLSLTDNFDGQLPPHWWDGAPDPTLPVLDLVAPGRALGKALSHVMSNSFAFGGNNVSLVFGRGVSPPVSVSSLEAIDA